MDAITKAIILFEGRCGSSHLAGILSQHPNAAFFGEEITGDPGSDWLQQKARIEEVFSLRRHNGKPLQAVGFKTKLRVIGREHHSEFMQFIVQNDVRLIRLYRRDLIKQSISAYRTMELVKNYGVFNIPVNDDRVKTTDAGPISKDKLKFWLRFFNTQEPDIDYFMMDLPASLKLMALSYEELLNSREDTIRRVCSFLGLEVHRAQDVYMKNTNDNLDADITNYDEVKEWLRGTRYAIKTDDRSNFRVEGQREETKTVSGEELVLWAYRLLLGREPGSAQAVETNPFKDDRKKLIESFLNSEEFKIKHPAADEGELPPAPVDYGALTGYPPVPTVAPIGIKLGSRVCRQADLGTDAFRYWISRMGAQPAMSRKLWEWFFIADALFQRDRLGAGRTGVGFGVGREPLVALFASLGCDILATDVPTDHATSNAWVTTAQHAGELSALKNPKICDETTFTQRVNFRAVDMNDIPSELDGRFDFCWSSCALEHLGSLEHGLSFIERSIALVKPNGIVVHTTEYNMTSNTDTVESPELSVYRRRDIDVLADQLDANGHHLEPVDYNHGHGYADGYVDLPPYQPGRLHLRLRIGAYACTSLGLIVRRGVGTAE